MQSAGDEAPAAADQPRLQPPPSGAVPQAFQGFVGIPEDPTLSRRRPREPSAPFAAPELYSLELPVRSAHRRRRQARHRIKAWPATSRLRPGASMTLSSPLSKRPAQERQVTQQDKREAARQRARMVHGANDLAMCLRH